MMPKASRISCRGNLASISSKRNWAISETKKTTALEESYSKSLEVKSKIPIYLFI
jgi:hypothetical protein